MGRNRNGSGSDSRITPRLERALCALLDNGSLPKGELIAKAAEAGGLNERSIYKALAKPHVQEWLKTRVQAHFDTVGVIRATGVLTDLLTADSDYVRADVAKHMLAIGGVLPATDRAAVGGGQPVTVNLHLQYVTSSPLLDAMNRAQPVQPKVIDAQPIE